MKTEREENDCGCVVLHDGGWLKESELTSTNEVVSLFIPTLLKE